MSDEPELRPAPRMSEQEIRDTVRALVQGRIFAMSQAPPDLWTTIFLPLGLGGLAGIDPATVGNVIEDLDKAGPLGINGYPMFLSCRVVHTEDWNDIVARWDRAQEALAEAVERE